MAKWLYALSTVHFFCAGVVSLAGRHDLALAMIAAGWICDVLANRVERSDRLDDCGMARRMIDICKRHGAPPGVLVPDWFDQRLTELEMFDVRLGAKWPPDARSGEQEQRS